MQNTLNRWQAQTIFGFEGGISKITGDVNEFTNMGYNIGLNRLRWIPKYPVEYPHFIEFNNYSRGSELANMGFNIGVELFRGISRHFQVGGRLAYNRFVLNQNEMKVFLQQPFLSIDLSNIAFSGSQSIIEILPCIRLISSSEKKAQFFVQIGVGINSFRYKVKATAGDESAEASYSERMLGLNFGAGIIIGISGKTKLSICPMYNSITEWEAGSKSYFAINIAVLFSK